MCCLPERLPAQVWVDNAQDVPVTAKPEATVQVGVDNPVQDLGIVVNKAEGAEGPRSRTPWPAR